MSDELFVERFGSGAAVVMVHGWAMHGGLWEDVVEGLVDHYQVVLVDLPGHGRSPPPPPQRAASLPALADAVLDAVGTSPALWVGWSLGGLVALRIALDCPAAVQRLALVASSPRFVAGVDWHCGVGPEVLEAFARGLETDYEGTLRRFLALEVHGTEHAAEQLRRLRGIVFQRGRPAIEALRGGLQILAESDLRSELAGLRPPLLLLLGRRDNLVPAAAGGATAALVAGARVRVMEEAGHAPFLVHPERFLEILEDFLGG